MFNMSGIKTEIKLKAKKIVTNSDFFSSIRRRYRYSTAKKQFADMYKVYHQSDLPQKIAKLKDIHNGKRCFIIGNGPSLTAKDLEMITKEYSFASNRIYLMYEKTSWRPTYYMCQDRQLMQTLYEYYSTCEEQVLLGYPALYYYNIHLDQAIYYLTDFRDANRIVDRIGFSENADDCVIDGGSVTYSAIQMAVYMGFKEIYLLGVDHNFSHTLDKNRRIIEHKDVKVDYFDDRYKDAFKRFEEKGKIYAAPDKGLMDLGFDAAERYTSKHDIKIFNATRGGKLETYPRIDLDELLDR